MSKRLPYDVLSYIAKYIERDTQLTCAVVCKQWTEPFLDAYWHYPFINSKALKSLCKKSNRNNVHLRNLHRTRGLTTYYLTEKEMKLFPTLQQIYQNINHVEYIEATDYEPILNTTDWSPWKSLRRLKIDYDYTWTELVRDILFTLSPLTSLVHFIFKTTSSHDDDIKGHGAASRLLTTTGVLESVKEIAPAKTIKEVCFDNDSLSTPWMFYFACKYPNLQTIRFKDGYRSPESIEEDYEPKYYKDDLQILSCLDQFFPCLKSAHIFTESWNGWPFSLFTSSLKHFGVKLEFLNYGTNSFGPDWLVHSNRCLQPVADSVQTMKLDIAYADDNKLRTNDFNLYPSLVKLRITLRSRPRINIILDKCPKLRILDLSQGEALSLSNYAKHSQNQSLSIHPLRRLNAQSTSIHPEIFKYLSFRCQQLLDLKLCKINLIEGDWLKTGQLHMDMLFSQLNTFELAQIHFSKQKTFKLFAIAQTENTNTNSTSNTNTNTNPDTDINLPEQSNQPQLTQLKWYHVCLDNSSGKQKAAIWELGSQDIDFAQRYYENFPENQARDQAHDQEQENLPQPSATGLIPRSDWQKDLQYGVIIIRVKSVKYFIFDSILLKT
ncbi:hypothetical protein PHYBLDRAFT_69958 [Phycomyces blakesleeanus NRRL 1555(-)]|uniref:Uncharacterized protein n=1 Tax=Phycomyces blakesleeanus (strain ATCC 8743b / DSM 1359 / FGSC 10004 / NBRC 33097 / NRRL 1555) TaxID=763407 RepID=A0A162N6S8_PHYB8|nr:hypothetical protein PHYBLDRAFT_69958 [Phycomyces blakesleeanus NRRL 1555(-)]OAD71708.1 hypothetical protein PHYBLDRAFT_69958 [Phycomyces blakesleeanus NRRL 1555(-)]|eukprot:XP_018289748.1 hypothetical protein PHYBLDRAFT_69958 [Phycomyces blakesleeanus NRRL 1555(-)]